MNRYRRSGNALAVTFALYTVLVATNLGEFWPFSIYPMFSQGGVPWSRSVVREVTDVETTVQWKSYAADKLPGEAYPLLDYGVDPIDLANFVSKTREWTDARVVGLRRMFGEKELEIRSLLVMRVEGRITDADSVQISFTPYVLMTSESTELHPALR